MGAAIGGAALGIPIVYVAIVSFGIVALLFLVCNELLIEAKNAQGSVETGIIICFEQCALGDDEKWWISIMVFLGIFIVLMLSHVIPV